MRSGETSSTCMATLAALLPAVSAVSAVLAFLAPLALLALRAVLLALPALLLGEGLGLLPGAVGVAHVEERLLGEVVGRHVHGLERRDRPASSRGDALLELAHLVGERRLVPDRRRHAPEQRRHLRTGLDEAEDVVDEEEDVLVLLVPEVLSHGQGR